MFPIMSLSKSKLFNRFVLMLFMQHWCDTYLLRVALVLHSCLSYLTRTAHVAHMCQIRVAGVARVSLLLLLSSTRVVNQTRSSSLFILNRLECGSQYTVWGYQDILPRGVFLGLRVLGHFVLQNETRKIAKIHKDFVLLQVFVYKFRCQNVIIYINDKQNSKIWV